MQSGLEYASLPDHLQQLISTRSGLHLSPQPFFSINPVLDAAPQHQIDAAADHELHLLHHFHQHGLVQDSVGEHIHEKEQERENREDEDEGGGTNKPGHEPTNRWPREETLALLKIRSSMEATIHDSNFKGPIWEHVSRKLAELGFNRSAKKCKEKFENVTKYYKKTKDGRQDGKTYRFYSELEALYNSNSKSGAPENEGKLIVGVDQKSNGEGTSEDETLENPSLAEHAAAGENMMTSKKRKKGQSFEEMKGLCEEMVRQMMQQQEELQRRFLEAVGSRDQERIQREEAWKMQELARLSKETEMRSQEHALVSSREAVIIGFLRKFTEDNNGEVILSCFEDQSKPSTSLTPSPNPNPIIKSNPPLEEEVANSGDIENDAKMGAVQLKRWPRSEVYALIKLRCKHEENFKENNPKGSLWEKISKEMMQMGYMRGAKRCKEKWENINKYFRKTKDAAKVRPPGSKTCPYFHQLSSLYQNGVLSFPSQRQDAPENSSNMLENGLENPFMAEGRSAEAVESSDSGYAGSFMNICGDNVGGVESQSSLMELVCKFSADYNGAD